MLLSVLLTVLLGCFAMNLASCCNVVLLCLEVFRVSCCTHNLVMEVSQNEECCYLVNKPFCVELDGYSSVVLFLYRWSVQPMMWGCSNGYRGVFMIVF